MDEKKYLTSQNCNDLVNRLQELLDRFPQILLEQQKLITEICPMLKGKKILMSFGGGELLVFADVNKCAYGMPPTLIGDIYIVESPTECENYIEMRKTQEYEMPIDEFREGEDYKILTDEEWNVFLDEYKRLEALAEKSKKVFNELCVKMALR